MTLIPVDNEFSYRRILLMPLHGTLLATMLGLAVFLYIGSATILGYLFFLLSLFATVRYAEIVVEKIMYGHKELPPLSPKDFNIFFNTSGFGIYALLSVLGLFGHFFVAKAGSAALFVYFALVIFATPAMIAATILERGLTTALNPVAIATIIRALGSRYIGVFTIVVLGFAVSSMAADMIGSRFVSIIASLYGLFLLCCAVGRLVFVSRLELGLNITSPDEFKEQQDRQYVITQDNNALQEALQKSRLAPAEAAAGLWEYHNQDETSLSRRFECFDALRKWPDPNTALRFAQPFAHYLVATDSKDNAVEVVRWCLTTEPEFRLADADTTYSLGVYTATTGQSKLAAFILQDMGKRYPEDPNTIPALIMAGKIAAQKLNNTALLKNVIGQLTALGISRQDPRLNRLINLAQELEGSGK